MSALATRAFAILVLTGLPLRYLLLVSRGPGESLWPMISFCMVCLGFAVTYIGLQRVLSRDRYRLDAAITAVAALSSCLAGAVIGMQVLFVMARIAYEARGGIRDEVSCGFGWPLDVVRILVRRPDPDVWYYTMDLGDRISRAEAWRLAINEYWYSIIMFLAMSAHAAVRGAIERSGRAFCLAVSIVTFVGGILTCVLT